MTDEKDKKKKRKNFVATDKEGHYVATVRNITLIIEGSAYCKQCKRIVDFKDCIISKNLD